MAWTSTDIIPANLNISCSYSASIFQFSEIVVVITATNSFGQPFDFSATIGLNGKSMTNIATFFQIANFNDFIPDIIDANSDSLSVLLSAGQVANAINNIGSTTPTISIFATDGTTTLLIAKGILTITVVP